MQKKLLIPFAAALLAHYSSALNLREGDGEGAMDEACEAEVIDKKKDMK